MHRATLKQVHDTDRYGRKGNNAGQKVQSEDSLLIDPEKALQQQCNRDSSEHAGKHNCRLGNIEHFLDVRYLFSREVSHMSPKTRVNGLRDQTEIRYSK